MVSLPSTSGLEDAVLESQLQANQGKFGANMPETEASRCSTQELHEADDMGCRAHC